MGIGAICVEVEVDVVGDVDTEDVEELDVLDEEIVEEEVVEEVGAAVVVEEDEVTVGIAVVAGCVEVDAGDVKPP